MKKQILSITLLLSMSFLANSQTTLYKNNIGLRPFVINNNGAGIGLNYERYLDSTNNFSIYVPVDIIFLSSNNVSYFRLGGEEHSGFALNPTFRIYFKDPKKFNWYMGVGFYYGESLVKLTNRVYHSESKTFGTLVNFGFKSTIKNRVTVCLDLGTGIAFINRKDESDFQSYYFYDNKPNIIGSLNFQVGYNF
jgi:hypothetical protein